MSERLKNHMGVPARVQEGFAIHLLLVDDGHEEIGGDKQHRAAEVGRGYTDDGERMFVQPNNAAHHTSIILEMTVPIGIAEDEIWSAVAALLIGAVEETAKIRLSPQHVEVVPTRRVAGCT